MLWSPSNDFSENSNLRAYMHWLSENSGVSFSGYQDLWQWSVANPDAFWESILRYFDVRYDGNYETVKSPAKGFNVSWFEGIQLNYAEHIFRKHTDKHPAIIYAGEAIEMKTLSWQELYRQVASLQHHLISWGIAAGDRIAGYLPCTSDATVGLLASASIGAVWSSCSPDFGTPAVVERFAQIGPKVLIAADGYQYGGKSFDKTAVIEELISQLPTLEYVIVVSEKEVTTMDGKPVVVSWRSVVEETQKTIQFTRVPFSHPLWILYSSGTTGLPKAFVHSQGGILLEQLKYGAFHNDFKSGERCFWYTTTGWMMWNYIHGSLLAGATMVLYDGSVGYPDLNVLWKYAEDAGINHFGTSAAYLLSNQKQEIHPALNFNLSSLRSISSTGSTLPPETFHWVYREVKKDLWLVSLSGGTDVCSAFVGGNPTWPVYAGEIQCRALGCNLAAFNEAGNAVRDEVGEMVILAPMPSMPIYFWNDPDHTRYHESYFQHYPNVWRHGDWIKITPHEGIIIYGRSDATLNRAGVRIGTSEIYRAMDKIEEVKDSLIICIEASDGSFWMPLFVVMAEGQAITDALKQKINKTLRADYSPRHVPDEIIAVKDIPYTISGKKTETPVKKVLMGNDPAEVVSAGSLKNPSSIQEFVSLARTRKI